MGKGRASALPFLCIRHLSHRLHSEGFHRVKGSRLVCRIGSEQRAHRAGAEGCNSDHGEVHLERHSRYNAAYPGDKQPGGGSCGAAEYRQKHAFRQEFPADIKAGGADGAFYTYFPGTLRDAHQHGCHYRDSRYRQRNARYKRKRGGNYAEDIVKLRLLREKIVDDIPVGGVVGAVKRGAYAPLLDVRFHIR